MQTTRVWDLPTRLFHWLFALCFVGAYATADGAFVSSQRIGGPGADIGTGIASSSADSLATPW